MKSVRLDGDNTEIKRTELREYFHQSYDLFESLFELLKDDTVFYLKSEPTRHPMVFYFGHTAVFYVNKLILAGVLEERINPLFESLFAVGVDEMAWDEASERFTWPSVDSVRDYRRQVRDVVDRLIMTLPMDLPIMQKSPFWAIWMGIEHERIHIETSSVLHRQMPIENIRPHQDFVRCKDHGTAPDNALVAIGGTTIVLGKGDNDQDLYGWDNEYGISTYSVSDFETSKYLVSNAEYLEFVKDGGYNQMHWWDEEGQKFLQLRDAKHPPFWVLQPDGSFRFRALAEEMAFPMDWPVEVNALEAQAFCRWKSAKTEKAYRLPTEAEWYVMVRQCGMETPIYDDTRANLNMAHGASSVPVNTFEQGELFDVVGNVWQWTQTPIDGFDGFQTHPWYDDFSTPTFDGKHNLIKGGSWISTGNEIVASSRYAFRRHFFQHAGFRYVAGGNAENQQGNRCIEDQEVARLCRQGYGEGYTFGPEAAQAIRPYITRRDSVMELGCGAGRLSLELSEIFEKVIGIDRSARFIFPAVELLAGGRFCYQMEGTREEILLSKLELSHAQERVEFYQGDMHNLKPHFSGYDCIVINAMNSQNDTLKAVTESMRERINEDGKLLVLTSAPLKVDATVFSYRFGGKECEGFVNVWH